MQALREFVQSSVSFSWAISLFGLRSLGLAATPGKGRGPAESAAGLDAVAGAAEQQLGSGLQRLFQTGDAWQRKVVDLALDGLTGGVAKPAAGPSRGGEPEPPGQPAAAAPRGREGSEMASETAPGSARVELRNTTQGPLWPPSELMDENGDFVVVGGMLLQETAPGEVSVVPNEKGAIVSRNTVPPLSNGKEDFTHPLGAPYEIVRELELGPDGKDRALRLHSVSCGPFSGDFGGGRPRIPASGESRYNLNSSPLWHESVAPIGAHSRTYSRPSYPLHEVPIGRLDQIPPSVTIGVPVDSAPAAAASPSGSVEADFRKRSPITLGDYLRGRGDLKITLLGADQQGGPTRARFDFDLRSLLPRSVYAFFALRLATLTLSPTHPDFLLPSPPALPNLVITDSQGDARASFEVANPFPDPRSELGGHRIVALVVAYKSSFQNWGASFTCYGTGADAHTALSADLSRLSELETEAPR